MSDVGDSIDIFSADPEPEPFVPPYVTTPPVRDRDRTRIALIATTCLLVLTLVAGSAAYVYTNNSSREWKATAERHVAELADMTAQREQVQKLLDASQTSGTLPTSGGAVNSTPWMVSLSV